MRKISYILITFAILIGVFYVGQKVYADIDGSTLAGWWNMDSNQISGVTLQDLTDNNNDGTITGADNERGKLGQSLTFNGSSDYIQAADSVSLSIIGNMSIAAWVKPVALPASGAFMSLVTKYDGTGGSPGGYDFRLSNVAGTQKIGFITRSTTADGGGDVNYTLPLGKWSLFVGTYDGANSKMYVNGVFVGQVTNTVNPANNTKLLNIGKFGLYEGSELGRYFNGSLDDVRIYERAITANDVAQLYNQGQQLFNNF